MQDISQFKGCDKMSAANHAQDAELLCMGWLYLFATEHTFHWKVEMERQGTFDV